MITRLKLKPGQNGTKALVKKYGEALYCVRYRYDAASHTRIKTVELIVEKKVIPIKPQKSESDALVPVQIAISSWRSSTADPGFYWIVPARLYVRTSG